ncbi:MAG: dimethylsulfonioproprionate lyase family protein [Aestuariivita sp.]|uniref:dimethylsulfonioproprionate lyase family protein n=1 Tax=Aestuariivita sp. TaxID=1872407 RepID=UPI003BAEE715
MTAEAFDHFYAVATGLVAAEPELMEFAGWPAITFVEKAHTPLPVVEILAEYDLDHTGASAELHRAVQAVAGYADWQQTYTEQEVGADFLARYGYFELIGPSGHFQSDQIRAYIAYWGHGLVYDWHLHEAEELYYIVSGSALFQAQGVESKVLGPGDIRTHGSNQPHAMTTTDSPVLTLVLWRGAGLTGLPRMGRA